MKELEEAFSEGYNEGFSQGVRYATMLACESLYVIMDELNADMMDIEQAQEIVWREVYNEKNKDNGVIAPAGGGELLPKGDNKDGNGHDNH